MPLLYIAIFVYFLNAANAESMDKRRGFDVFQSRIGDFTGFWTESSDDCKNFTKRTINLKMAQGHFTLPGKYGGFYCFPISRRLSRIGRFKTEIIDENRNYRLVFYRQSRNVILKFFLKFLLFHSVMIFSRLLSPKMAFLGNIPSSSDLGLELSPASTANF